MRKSRPTARVLAAPLVLAALVVLSGACRRVTAPNESVPSPEPTSTVLASPVPLTSAQLEAEQVFYVVGPDGIVGSDGMNAGTETFGVTNNDARPHEIEFVRLDRGHESADVQAALQDGIWPAPWATVLDRADLALRQTVMMRVEPLRVGSYALVEVGATGGRPVAADASFIKPIAVVEAPG